MDYREARKETVLWMIYNSGLLRGSMPNGGIFLLFDRASLDKMELDERIDGIVKGNPLDIICSYMKPDMFYANRGGSEHWRDNQINRGGHMELHYLLLGKVESIERGYLFNRGICGLSGESDPWTVKSGVLFPAKVIPVSDWSKEIRGKRKFSQFAKDIGLKERKVEKAVGDLYWKK